MANVLMEIEEVVLNEYEITYNEEELEAQGFDSLEEFLKMRYNGNPWFALMAKDIIQDICITQTLEYCNSEIDTIEYRG